MLERIGRTFDWPFDNWNYVLAALVVFSAFLGLVCLVATRYDRARMRSRQRGWAQRERAQRERAQRERGGGTPLSVLIVLVLAVAVAGILAVVGWGGALGFMAAFGALTFAYAAVILLCVFVWRVIPRLVYREPVSLIEELQRTLEVFIERPVTIDRPTGTGGHERALINLANNHRWYALVAMMIASGILAFIVPGEPLLPSIARALCGAIMGDESCQHLFYFLFTGWFTPNTPPTPFKYQPRPAAGLIENWFFLKAQALYAVSAIVYFFPAFWDDFRHVIRRVAELVEEQRRQQAARQTPATTIRIPFWKLLSAVFIGKVLAELTTGFFQLLRRHHRRR